MAGHRCNKTEQVLKRMDEAYANNDKQQAIEAGREILADGNPDHDALQRVAMLMMDYDESPMAQKAIDRIAENFSINGYDGLLLARWAYLNKDYESAIIWGEKALQMGGMTDAQSAMTHNLLGHIYRVLGDLETALPHFSRAKDETYLCGEQDYSNYLFNLHYMDVSPAFLYEEAKGYGALFAGVKQYEHNRKRHQHRRLRIGYISPDLRRHVVAFFSYAFLKYYDRNEFAVYAYANNKEDGVSREYAACIDEWRNILNVPADEAAKQIYKDEIDILVDLAGHTANNSLAVLAYKPAPVQISGVGYFDTTGLQAVDYILADKYTAPLEDSGDYFVEKLLRLPHSHLCYMWHDAPQSIEMSAFRQNGYVTFGSFNNFTKVNDKVLSVWARILAAVPDSKLMLKAKVFNLAYGRKLALKRMEMAGISIERVIIEEHEADYLSHYRNMDIALDTFPYPGGGTTCDALYMGVPVITMKGDKHHSRFGCSIMMNLGLPELCADDVDEYVRRAVELAKCPSRLSELHQTLRRRMRQSPLMDAAQYMLEIEQGYKRIWRNWLAGYKTASVTVNLSFAAEDAWQKGRKFFLETGGENGLLRAKPWLRMAAEMDDKAYEPAMLYSELCYQLNDHVGAYEAAKLCIERAESSAIEQPEVFWPSIYCRKAYAAMQLGYIEEAFEAYNAAWQKAPKYSNDAISMFDSMLLCGHLLPFSSQDMYDLHVIYQQQIVKVEPYTHTKGYGHKKIRIGYLSPDFRRHVMFPFYYGMLFCYDKENFAVYCYHHNDQEDEYTQMIRESVDSFVSVSQMNYAEIAGRIRSDEIDVLVDLAGHSAKSALPVLAYRPAPVQMSGIGYLSTTGLKEVDYYITDSLCDPPGEHDTYFTEKLFYLSSHFSYAVRSDVPEPLGTAAKDKGYITLGVFNHYRKITQQMLGAWLEIMKELPSARLLMKSTEFENDSLTDTAYNRLQSMGYDMERVQFEAADDNYMERYLDVDIALDTYPYTGGGTTFDALYMGVPVISLYGERRNTRFGLSILFNIGLSELAVSTLDDYVAKVVALGKDLPLMDELHRQIRGMMMNCKAINPKYYERDFEEKITHIIRQEENEEEKRVSLTFSYIVRNEEKNLPVSLVRIKKIADEIIVVDTGSNDRTVAIAEDYGARVYHYEWCNDFAAARNYALEKCSCKWIVFLDADEYFPEDMVNKLPKLLEQAEEQGKRALLLTLKNIDTSHGNKVIDETYVLRIFRNDKSFRYEGKIHEQLRENGKDIKELGIVHRETLHIIHTGYSDGINKKKAERNLQMLLRELKESSSPERVYGFLADAYYGLGNMAAAKRYAGLDINEGRRSLGGTSRSFRLMLEILAKEGIVKERVSVARQAVAAFPELPEFQAELAECLLATGNIKGAVAAGEKALSLWHDGVKGWESTSFTAELAVFLRQRVNKWKNYCN